MKNISHSTYLKMPIEKRVHYLAEAKQGSSKRTLEEVDGQVMPFYRASIREVIVDTTLYTDRRTAKHRADAVLLKVREKSCSLKAASSVNGH